MLALMSPYTMRMHINYCHDDAWVHHSSLTHKQANKTRAHNLLALVENGHNGVCVRFVHFDAFQIEHWLCCCCAGSMNSVSAEMIDFEIPKT